MALGGVEHGQQARPALGGVAPGKLDADVRRRSPGSTPARGPDAPASRSPAWQVDDDRPALVLGVEDDGLSRLDSIVDRSQLRIERDSILIAAMVIAIDGPAGAGKSTVARALAARLGITYLDSGAMYRTVALATLRAGEDPDDAEQ